MGEIKKSEKPSLVNRSIDTPTFLPSGQGRWQSGNGRSVEQNCCPIDFFHGLNILLSAFKFARPASYWITYSFDFKARERGLPGKFEWRQKNNLYREKGLWGGVIDNY